MSIQSALHWIGLAVKCLKMDTVSKYFRKEGFGKYDCLEAVTEASENVAAISKLYGIQLPNI